MYSTTASSQLSDVRVDVIEAGGLEVLERLLRAGMRAPLPRGVLGDRAAPRVLIRGHLFVSFKAWTYGVRSIFGRLERAGGSAAVRAGARGVRAGDARNRSRGLVGRL